MKGEKKIICRCQCSDERARCLSAGFAAIKTIYDQHTAHQAILNTAYQESNNKKKQQNKANTN